jgi:NADPH2:quinone reductase
MKALVCREFGPVQSLAVMDVPKPAVLPGRVLIRVEAASVNYPDALLVQGKYQFKPELPFIAGSEVAGTVEAVGEGVSQLKCGERALALCGRGGFAEYVLVDADTVFPLPDQVDSAQAAAMPVAYATSYYALLDRGQLAPGETLLVLGAGGGVGIAAVELGKIMGASVIAAASSNEKLQAAKLAGADQLIDYSSADLRTQLREIVGSRGIDVIYDPVGGPHSEAALRSMAWGGRHLVVGFAAGDIPRIPLNLLLLKGCSIVGVWWGDFRRRFPALAIQELAQLIEWLRDGKIRPLVSKRYPLSEGPLALQALLERRALGKLVLLPQQ